MIFVMLTVLTIYLYQYFYEESILLLIICEKSIANLTDVHFIKVLVKDDDKKRIIEIMHQDLVGGCHFGQEATWEKVSSRFWWRGQCEDVRTFVRGCSTCQLSNASNKPPPSTLHPIPVHEIFHRWGVDLIGPLHETSKGKKYIIVATEYLTKWAEVKAVRDKSADSVHSFLMKLVFRFGPCAVLLHDQGREFCNVLVEGLCQRLGIGDARSSAYHPQTNGLTG